MRRFLFGALLLLASFPVYAKYTLHILSPWKDDPTYSTYVHHLVGSPATDYNADVSGTKTKMSNDGDGWYSFTWDTTTQFNNTVTLHGCPEGNTWCGSAVDWKPGTPAANPLPKLSVLFANSNEVWIYPSANAPYFSLEMYEPGSRIVWFKSPWGNKALPRIIVGSDTVRMFPAYDDALHCGWFKGGIAPGKSTAVHFQRPHTDWALPASGNLELSSVLSSQNIVYVDGTAAVLAAAKTLGSAGECFDSSRTIHVLSPWFRDSQRKTQPVYLNIDGNVFNQDTAMGTEGEYEFWSRFDVPTEKTISNEWSTYSKVSFVSYYPKKGENYKKYKQSLAVAPMFPSGEYEVWMIPKGDSNMTFTWTPIQPRYIQFLNPWTATTPSIVIGGDTSKMTGVSSSKCGWYQARVYDTPASWDVLFKQSIGKELYSASGLLAGSAISLDSIMKEGDSAWITPTPYPTGAPVVSSHYSGVLGDCGKRNLSVMVIDWLGEGEDQYGGNTNHDDKNGRNTKDINFGGAYNGTSETKKTINGKDYNGCQGLVLGMVEPALGENGVPVRSATFPDTACTSADSLNDWFIPTVVAESGGKEYTNATCRDIPLVLDDEGFWSGDYNEDETTQLPGFFPVDDFKYLDEEETVLNPKWDSVYGGSNWKGYRNFSFAMVVQAEFEYVKGQYFEFRGDDDVWVFINNRLVVDIGGVHGPLEGFVDVDTVGAGDGNSLVEGETYPFHIFFAERNATGSNFKMRTSMDLQTQRTYYQKQVKTTDGTIKYEIWQIVKEKSLTCDGNSEAESRTELAPSNYTLYGAQFGTAGVALKGGWNYKGIYIDSLNQTSFIIDTTLIMQARSLAPGSYKLVFANAADPTLSGEIHFYVPSYPLPEIAFADSSWSMISPDTTTLGEWAFQPYPVRIMAKYMTSACADCNDVINLYTSDSLVFLDADRSQITSVTLDSGKATFWIMGQKALDSAAFRAAGPTVLNELTWKRIKLKEPPVPTLKVAEMHDNNGDGRPDSLYMGYSRALLGKDAVDSLFWRWGDDARHQVSAKMAANSLKNDSALIFTGDSLVKFIATGGTDSVAYQGSLTTWFTYVPTEGADKGKPLPFEMGGSIADRVAPIIQSAVIAPGDKVDTLSITFSESIADSFESVDTLLNFLAWRSGAEKSSQAKVMLSIRRGTGYRYDLMLSNSGAVVLGVGDSVRLAPGLAYDYAGNRPHANNPWVRIVGKQRSYAESPGVVTLVLDSTAKSSVVTPVSVALDKNIKDVVEELGIPGHLIRYDMSNLLNNDSTLSPEDVVLSYETYYFSNLGQYLNHAKGTVGCTDSIFSGDCSKNPGNIFLGWNARSKDNRLVGTGAYVATIQFSVRARGRKITDVTDRDIWGILRKE
jgi:fibro-slime domain-containing protein